MEGLHRGGSVLYDIAVTDVHAAGAEVFVCPIAVTAAIWYDDRQRCLPDRRAELLRAGRRRAEEERGRI